MPELRARRLGHRDSMTERHQPLLLGIDEENFEWARENFTDFLEQQGLTVEAQHTWPRTDVVDAAAAAEDEDMRNKQASWLRSMPEGRLRLVLEQAESRGDRIWGVSAVVEGKWSRVTTAIDALPDELATTAKIVLLPDEHHGDAPDTDYEPDGPKNPDAPFSYDPANDYYTEPGE